MNTTTTTAAAEAAKNLAIYNAVADHARHAFEYLNIKPGQYTPAQIVAELKKSRAAWKDNAPAVGDEGGLVRVAVDAFACQFPLLNAFDVLAQLSTAYDIPTRDRVTFERAAETAPAVVSFMVPTAAADVAKAVAKKAPDREALTFAYIDTERRALVGTDGHVLTVAAVPSLQVAEGARRGYLVARGLLKADRVTIDTNNNATDGHNVAESPEWLRFPVWSPVFPDVYDTDALTIDNATRRALTKAVAAAAKYATPDLKDTRHVAIFGEAGTDRLTIRARREIATPTAEDPHAVKYEYMDTAVQLPATLSRSLAFAFHGPDFATLPAFDTLYITPNESRAAVVISKRAAAVLVPQPLPDGYDRICKTDERPAFAVQLHPLADLLDVYTDAPDTLTAAPAADGHQDTPATTGTTTTPAEAISESESEPTAAAPAADGHQSESEADALPVTFYDPAAGVIVWGLADELPTADGLTAESVTAADLLTIESERESAAPADGHQDTTTTAHDSESRPRALLLTLTRAALRLAAVVAALLLLTFANDRPTPATATTTAADLLAPADHQDTPAEVISESESADTLTTTPAEVISEPTESEPTARPAADRPAVKKRHHARENKRESRAELMTAAAPAADLLTADTLTAAPVVVDRDTLTAPAVVISESESQDTTTTRRPLLTADELAELLALLTGTTTAESVTAAPAADDSQDTPATTGTTTPAAPAAGCPAAVATPCPPAAPVAPVAPIIF